MNTEPDESHPKKRKISGCGILTILGVSFLLLVLIPPKLAREHAEHRVHSCANNLNTIGIALKFYAEKNEGLYPALSLKPGKLMLQPNNLISKHLYDGQTFVCPVVDRDLIGDTDQASIDDHSYFYLSHVLTNEAEGFAYVEAYKTATLEGNGFDHDFMTNDGTVLPRINTTKISISEAHKIPVIIERSGHHSEPYNSKMDTAAYPDQRQSWGNVLFLDGHVEFMQLTPEFPMTTSFIEALESIDQ